MFHGLVKTANRWFDSLHRSLLGGREPNETVAETPAVAQPVRRLRFATLTDEVSRTLFDEYARHRASARGEEEIGWVLLGIRECKGEGEGDFAQVMATLPAGMHRSAGVAHVQFNSEAQALASRIVRQWDKRLMMLGVVHTHPGSMRHPSKGDLQGDRLWVRQLRGGEGIFAIGTADGAESHGAGMNGQAAKSVQWVHGLVLSWYALGEGDESYRPLEVRLSAGPDLALPLHGVWATLEFFARPLERLFRQQAGVTFQVIAGTAGPALAVRVKLAEPSTSLLVVLENERAAYYWERGNELLTVDPLARELDRGVYLVLAELAGQSVRM